MTSKRIRGSRVSLVLIESDPTGSSDGTDHWSDLSTVRMVTEGQPVLDWNGHVTAVLNEQSVLEISGVQSLEPTSFWRIAWQFAGQELPFKFAPGGNFEATPDQPHFVGKARLGTKPVLGGEASVLGSHMFDTVLYITEGPEMVSFEGEHDGNI